MSFSVSFKALNDGRVLSGAAFRSLSDGADIRELTNSLISEISNEDAQVFGYDRITVAKKWLDIQWDQSTPVGLFYNAGIISSTGKLVFNPKFLADMVNRYGKDVLVSVLCHEIGHRMVYLLLIRAGIRVNSWEHEYCADYIAGLLARLSGTSPDPMRKFYIECCAKASESHPAGKDRVEAFNRGYTMVDKNRETVFLREKHFAPSLNTKLILTEDFMRKRMREDILGR